MGVLKYHVAHFDRIFRALPVFVPLSTQRPDLGRMSVSFRGLALPSTTATTELGDKAGLILVITGQAYRIRDIHIPHWRCEKAY